MDRRDQNYAQLGYDPGMRRSLLYMYIQEADGRVVLG